MEDLNRLYGRELDFYSLAYDVMGKLLDSDSVIRFFAERNIERVYICGGGYLGIQLFNAIREKIEVIGIIDKSGKTKYPIKGAKCIDYQRFSEIYAGECVVVTPLQHNESIYNELKNLMDESKLIFVGEIIDKI